MATLNANTKEIVTLQTLYDLIKTITSNANTKEIFTLQTVYDLI